MRKNMSVFCLFLCLLFCLFLCVPACAESAETSSRVPVIQDDADLLSEAEEEALREEMLPICEFGTPMFWTTMEAGDYERLAENFFHSRLSLRESGILFVINMKARQLTIFSDGAIYRTVTDAEAVTITDNVFRMAGRGEYYACASSAFVGEIRWYRAIRRSASIPAVAAKTTISRLPRRHPASCRESLPKGSRGFSPSQAIPVRR